jgi:alpha-1,2-mannosyltransferase
MALTARRVSAALWLLAVLLSLVALAQAATGDLSVARLWWDIAHGRIGAESWLLLERASVLAPAGGGNLYQSVFFDHGIKLTYPPSALLLMRGAAAICSGCGGGTIAAWFTAIGVALTLAIPVVTAAVLLRSPWAREASARDRLLLTAGVGALCAVYYPLVLANALGQVQAWLNGLFAAACWAFLRGRHGAAGAIVGLMALVKPHGALLVLWAAARGHRRFACAALLVMLAGIGLSLYAFGLESHLGYFRLAALVAERGESMYANQSINGLLNRLLLPHEQLGWSQTLLPPYHPAVAAGTRVALAAGLALAFLWPLRTRAAGRWPDFALVSTVTLVASPIGWEHYYPLLLPLYAMYVANADGQVAQPRFRLVCASVLLTGAFIGPLARLDARPWSLLQSYQLAGALLFLAALVVAIRPPRADAATPRA